MVAAPQAERAAILEQACGDDDSLRAEVASLLEHYTRAGDDFLAPAVVVLRPDQDGPPAWAQKLVGGNIGRYTIVRLIGYGGMGCVFEARQEQPTRSVALKVLQPGFGAPSALARFRPKSELLGRLQHRNIAQVYEAGTHEGESGLLPYFAMEFIADAQPLLEYADGHRLATRQRLELLAKVCDAVHHGHQNGIIHRDGDPAAIDTRSDVYSLGLVLYDLRTGVLPYETTGSTIYAATRAIKEQVPARPSTRCGRLGPGSPAPEPAGWRGPPARELRGDIDTIVLKALEQDRERRYAPGGGAGGRHPPLSEPRADSGPAADALDAGGALGRTASLRRDGGASHRRLDIVANRRWSGRVQTAALFGQPAARLSTAYWSSLEKIVTTGLCPGGVLEFVWVLQRGVSRHGGRTAGSRPCRP